MVKLALLILTSALLLSPLSATRAAPTKAPKEAGEISGNLEFKSWDPKFVGTDVGRGNNVRKFIAGSSDSSQRVVSEFEKLPKSLTTAPGDVVPMKLKCEHFWLSAGAVSNAKIVIRVVSHTCPQVSPNQKQKGEWQWAGKDEKGNPLKEQYEKAVAAFRAKNIDPNKSDEAGWKAANELADKFGFYETSLTDLVDLKETDINLPAGLFRNALKNAPELDAAGKPKRPLVTVYVKCETPQMMIGMMKGDVWIIKP